MLLALRIARRAATEVEQAELWWRENRLAAPNALREDIQGAFSLLLRQPGVGTRIGNTKLSGVRRLHLGRIRYFVYYQIRGGELVVLSLWHSSRGKGPKL